MKTLLIVTQLDYRYFSNTRTHHMVEQFLGRFSKITVLHKAHATGNTLREKIRSFFTIGVREYERDPVSLIEVSPLFNAQNGLGVSMLGLGNPYALPPSLIKRFLRRAFSSMGFVLELAILPSLLLAYIIKDRGRYDVFIGGGVWAITMGYLLKKTGRVKLLVSDDYDYSPGSQPISAFRRWYTNLIEIMMLRRSDLVFSVGELLAGLRREQTGKSVDVIPNGVNYRLFKPGKKKSPTPPTLIYIGAVEGWSGLDIVITAMAEARGTIPEAGLIIVGHGPVSYTEKLKELVGSYSLEKNVRFLGARQYSELPSYMSESALGLAMFMPVELRKYAFSLKVIEYMAAGLPVLATKGTQSGVVVEEAGAGLAVEYDSHALAEAICRLLENKEFYEECSQRAVKNGSEYDWKSIMERCYSLIENRYESLFGS